MRSSSLSVAVVGLFLACWPSVASAGSAWQMVLPDVKARVVAEMDAAANAPGYAALEIEMPDNFRTYWRIPGEGGLPPAVTVDVGNAEILYPLPKVEKTDGYVDYVYHGHTVLPMKLNVPLGARHVSIAVTLGICDQICMPVDAHFDVDLGQAPEGDDQAMIEAALATIPATWQFPDPAIAEAKVDPEGPNLLVKAGYPGVNLVSIVASVPGGSVLFGAAEGVAEPGLATIPILNGAAVPETVDLQFDSDMGPFEVTVPVQR